MPNVQQTEKKVASFKEIHDILDTLKDGPDNTEDLFQLLENVEDFYGASTMYQSSPKGTLSLPQLTSYNHTPQSP